MKTLRFRLVLVTLAVIFLLVVSSGCRLANAEVTQKPFKEVVVIQADGWIAFSFDPVNEEMRKNLEERLAKIEGVLEPTTFADGFVIKRNPTNKQVNENVLGLLREHFTIKVFRKKLLTVQTRKVLEGQPESRLVFAVVDDEEETTNNSK